MKDVKASHVVHYIIIIIVIISYGINDDVTFPLMFLCLRKMTFPIKGWGANWITKVEKSYQRETISKCWHRTWCRTTNKKATSDVWEFFNHQKIFFLFDSINYGNLPKGSWEVEWFEIKNDFSSAFWYKKEIISIWYL